ncbi:hypothetical protein, partial [Streptomyces sp. NPDC059489]|uniref:hypothetical protein n=1 Tax=Streptomyces sp. NPDC059489 TaxID=3346849 RepID=UPI0036CD2A29
MSETKAITFDPDPVIELGNAWITFGDALDEQMANMAGAQFDLLNGGWTGEAANSMSFAFENNYVASDGNVAGGGLRPLVEQVVESCWDLGESINYFAMLRSEQAASEAKVSLAMVLATVIGGILGLFTMFIGEIVGLIGEALEALVTALGSVARTIGSAISELTQIVPELEGLVGEIAEVVAPITQGIGDITTGIASVGARAATIVGDGVTGARSLLDANAWLRYPIMTAVYGGEFVGVSAATTAATDAILGTNTDWSHWSPIPVTGEGWQEFAIGGAMGLPFIGAGGALKGAFGKYKTSKNGGVDVNAPDVTINTTPNVTPPSTIGSGRRGGVGATQPRTPLSSAPPRIIDRGSAPVKPAVNGPTNSRSVVRTGPGGGTVRTPVDVNDAHTKPTSVTPIRTSSPPVTRMPGRATSHSAPVTDAGAPPARIGSVRGDVRTQVSTPDGGQPPTDRPVTPTRAVDERRAVSDTRGSSVPDAVSRPAVEPDNVRSRPADGTGTREGEPAPGHSPSGMPRQDLTDPRRGAGTSTDAAASRSVIGEEGTSRGSVPDRETPSPDRSRTPEETESVRTSSRPVTDPPPTGTPSRGAAPRGGDTPARVPADDAPAAPQRTSSSDTASRAASPSSSRVGGSSEQTRHTTPTEGSEPLPDRSERPSRSTTVDGADSVTRPGDASSRLIRGEDRPASTSRSGLSGADRGNAVSPSRNDMAAGAGRSETPAPGERASVDPSSTGRPVAPSEPTGGMRRPTGAGDLEPAPRITGPGRNSNVPDQAVNRPVEQRDGTGAAPAARSSAPQRTAELGDSPESVRRSADPASRTTLTPEPAGRTSESATRPGTDQDAGSGATPRHPASSDRISHPEPGGDAASADGLTVARTDAPGRPADPDPSRTLTDPVGKAAAVRPSRPADGDTPLSYVLDRQEGRERLFRNGKGALISDARTRLQKEEDTFHQRVNALSTAWEAFRQFRDDPVEGSFLPDPELVADLEAVAREAGVPESLLGSVTDTVREAVKEHWDDVTRALATSLDPRRYEESEPVPPGDRQERVTQRLESVLGDAAPDVSARDLAARALELNERFEPEGWARKAGVPDAHVAEVAHAYYLTRLQEIRESGTELDGLTAVERVAKMLAEPPSVDRLAEMIGDRIDEDGHGPSARAVAETMVREDARSRAPQPRPWREEAAERFVAQDASLRDAYQRGEMGRQTFERRLDALGKALPERYRLEAEVLLTRQRMEGDFDRALADVEGRPTAAQLFGRDGLFGGDGRDGRWMMSPADEAKVRGDILDETVEAVQAIARRHGIADPRRDLGREPDRSAEWEAFQRDVRQWYGPRQQGLQTRLELAEEATRQLHRMADSRSLDRSSKDWQSLRDDFLAEYTEATRALPDGRVVRTLPVDSALAGLRQLDSRLAELAERWQARLDAKAAEDALIADARQEQSRFYEVFTRHTGREETEEWAVRDLDGKVLDEHLADFRKESARLLDGRSPKDLSRADWDAYITDLADVHVTLVKQMPGRYDLHVGLDQVAREVNESPMWSARQSDRATSDVEVARVREDFRSAMADAYRRHVGMPEEGVWPARDLAAREAAFRRESFAPYVDSLVDRVQYESDLSRVLRDGADEFHTIATQVDTEAGTAGRRYDMSEGTFKTVSGEFRDDLARLHHMVYGPTDRNLAGWLTRERQDGDVFQSQLQENAERAKAQADTPRYSVDVEAWRTRLGSLFRDLNRRTRTSQHIQRELQERAEALRDPRVQSYVRDARDIDGLFVQEFREAGTEAARDLAVARANFRLRWLTDTARHEDAAYRWWESDPLAGPRPRLDLPLPPWRRAVVSAPEQPKAELDPAASVSAPVQRLRQALADLRPQMEHRAEAYREFQKRLVDRPDRSELTTALWTEPVEEVRDWFADQWTQRPPVDPRELETQLQQRLDRVSAVLGAKDIFDREVEPAGPADSSPGFTYGDAATALRDQFVQEMNALPLSSHARTGAAASGAVDVLVERYRKSYAQAAQASLQLVERQQLEQQANDAFDKALRVRTPQGDLLDLAHPPAHVHNAGTWYIRQTEGMRHRYIRDYTATRTAEDSAQSLTQLNARTQAQARSLAVRAATMEGLSRRIDELVENRRTVGWSRRLTNWYSREQRQIADVFADSLPELTPESQPQAEADLVRRLDTLFRVAQDRHAAEKEFDRVLADDGMSPVDVTSQLAAAWADERIRRLREEHVHAYLKQRAEGHGEQEPAEAFASALPFTGPGGRRGSEGVADHDVIEAVRSEDLSSGVDEEPDAGVDRNGPGWDPDVLAAVRRVLDTEGHRGVSADQDTVARWHEQLPGHWLGPVPRPMADRAARIAQLIVNEESPHPGLRGGAPHNPYRAVLEGLGLRRPKAEPDLDALARAAGLHHGEGAADAWATSRVRQYVRTLDETFGPTVVTSPSYTGLLQKLHYLDTLRWNTEPDGQTAYFEGRMSARLLRTITLDVLGLSEDTAQTPEHWTRVLDLVAAAHERTPSARIEDLGVDGLLPQYSGIGGALSDTSSADLISDAPLSGTDRVLPETNPAHVASGALLSATDDVLFETADMESAAPVSLEQRPAGENDTAPATVPPGELRVHFEDGTVPRRADRPTFAQPGHSTVETSLRTYRRPELDREMQPPSHLGRTVVFEDGSRMPSYITGDGTESAMLGTYGTSIVELRGLRQVADEIVTRAGLSGPAAKDRAAERANALEDLRRALRDTPWVFHGDGYRGPTFLDDRGWRRHLRVTTRPHNAWERFADGYGSPFKFDNVQRSQVTTGASAQQRNALRITPAASLGPVGGIASYARIGVGVSYGRTYDYAMQNQVLSQVETRMGDTSHLYLDDVQYEVRLEGYPFGRKDWDGFVPGESHFTFGVRNGLAVRLSQSETKPGPAGRMPLEMDVTPDASYRLVHTEGFGPVDKIRQWALDRLEGESAQPGASAHDEVSRFFTTENFHRMADRLAQGPVTTRQLTADSWSRKPLGVFVVDRVIPGRATLLTETTAAEMRTSIQTTIKNERTLVKAYGQEVSATVGPSSDFPGLFGPSAGLRAVAGWVFRYGRTTEHGSAFGGSGSRKIVGRAKKVPTGLYLVRKTVYVRRTGDAEPTPFETWSLDRMTSTEARRLAGWDDGTALDSRKQNEPFAPAYLTRDDPSVLGMSRPEAFLHESADDLRAPDDERNTTAAGALSPDNGEQQVEEASEGPRETVQSSLDTEEQPPGTGRQSRDMDGLTRVETGQRVGNLFQQSKPRRGFLEEFTDQVLRAAAEKYPDMVAPLEDFGDAKNSRWRGSDHYRTALQNTLHVIHTLGHHSMVGNLETVITTGLPIELVVPGRLHRAHRYIWIEGRLTDRRYEGTQNDLYLRTGAPGTDRLDGTQNVVQGVENGVVARLQVRDAVHDLVGRPENLGLVEAGPRWGRQRGSRTGYGSTTSFESLSVSTSPSHLYSYRLELTASTGGFRRFRQLVRGTLSFGLLATRFFVSREPEAELAGAQGDGRVLLSVPSEHVSLTDPHATAPHGPRYTESDLTSAEAEALATGDVTDTSAQEGNPFGNLPYYVVSVGAHEELVAGVEQVMDRVSNGNWQFTQKGAPAHSAMTRPFRSPYLSAGFDQTSGPAGTRTNGLFGLGPYLNRLGMLVHRTGVSNLTVSSKPIKTEGEYTLSSDTLVSGAHTTRHSFTVAATGYAGHTHETDPTVEGRYGFAASISRSNTLTKSVSRTVTSEVNPWDTNYKVLLVGDSQHDVAGTVRGDGVLTPLHTLATWTRTHWAGKRFTFASDWVGHVTEKVAHRLGLIRDGLGSVPLYTAHTWRQPQWLRDNLFGSYPVGSLDATKVLSEFDQILRDLGADDASRDRVRNMGTPRALRALRDQMTSGGATSRARVGRYGWGRVRILGRTLEYRAELVADEPTFDGLGHSTAITDGRHATESTETVRSDGNVKSFGPTAADLVRTGAALANAAGPSYAEQGSSSQQTVSGDSHTRMRGTFFTANEPYAEYLTQYRLRLTLTLPDGRKVTSEGPIGELRDQVPLSLSESAPPAAIDDADAAAQPTPHREVPQDLLGTPTVEPPEAQAHAWDPVDVTAQNIEKWRETTHAEAQSKPFTMPDAGFHVRQVVGLDNVRTAADIAVAKAYGTPLGNGLTPGIRLQGDRLAAVAKKARESGPTKPGTATPSAQGVSLGSNLPSGIRLRGDRLAAVAKKARESGLTRLGTEPSLALHDGTTAASLAAFFSDTTEPDGYQVAGLYEDTFVGGAEGDYRLYSRPDVGAATLLTIAPSTAMESAERSTRGHGSSVIRGGGQQPVFGGGPGVVTNEEAGRVLPGLRNADVGTSETDTRRQDSSQAGQTTLRPTAGRAFLFAIPTTWLGVANVHRTFNDSRLGRWVRQSLGPFGLAPGRQAVETDAHVIAWVREDVARELGLVTDDNFPKSVADGWDKVKKATDAWVAADNAYWNTRRAMPDLRAAHQAARAELRAAKKELTEARQRGDVEAETQARADVRDATRAVAKAIKAQTPKWLTLAKDLKDAEKAAADLHRVRAEADRLTRYHRLSADERQDVAEPPEVSWTPAPVATKNSAPAERWTTTPGETDGPAVLTSPDGTRTYTLQDVPRDGDAFFRSFADGLAHIDRDRLSHLVEADTPEETASAVRALLADHLHDPDNSDLLAFVAPDTKDVFSPEEVAEAGLHYPEGSPEQREFEATGHIPLHGLLPDEARAALAAAQLRRPGTADGEAGWNHGAADVLPALAARAFDVKVTLVRDGGSYADYLPRGEDSGESLPQVVLHLADKHYRVAHPVSGPVTQHQRPAPGKGAGPEVDSLGVGLSGGQVVVPSGGVVGSVVGVPRGVGRAVRGGVVERLGGELWWAARGV